MKRLIYYNLYRFFSNPKNLAAVFIVLLLNAVMLSAYCSNFGTEDDGLTYSEASASSDIANRITIFDGNRYSRYTIGSQSPDEESDSFTIENTVASAGEYKDNINSLIGSAQFFLGGDFPADSALVRYEKSVVDIYSALDEKISLDGEKFSDTRFFGYSYDILFLIVLLLAYLIPTYTDDSSLDLLGIVRATEKGRSTLGIAKLISLIIYIIFISSLFSVTSALFCPDDIPWLSPVQTMPEMALCAYDFTVLGYFLISWICKTAVLIIAALIFLPFIIMTYNTAAGAVFAFGICAVNVSLSFAGSFTTFSPLNYVSLYTLSDPVNIFGQYKVVTIGDAMFPLHTWFGIYILSLVILLFPLYMVIFAKRRTVLSPRLSRVIVEKIRKIPAAEKIIRIPAKYINAHTRRGRAQKYRHISVRSHEIFKIYSASGIKVILIALLGVNLVLNYHSQTSVTLTERIYKSYITYYQGEVLEESYITPYKYEQLETSLTNFSKSHDELASAEENFSNGLITPERYREILDEYSTLDLREDIFSRFTEYFQYIAQRSKTNKVSFVYETGWNKFFTRSPDYVLYIAVILLASYIFTIEHDSKSSAYQTASIVRATPYGRLDLFGQKMKILLLSVSSFSALSELISISSIIIKYGLPHPGAAASSLRIFSSVEIDIPLFILAGIGILLRFSSALMFAVFCCGISELFEKRLPTMLISISVIIFPLLIRNMRGNETSAFGLDSLISGGNLIISVSLSAWSAILACITLVLFVLIVISVTSAASAKWNHGTTVK